MSQTVQDRARDILRSAPGTTLGVRDGVGHVMTQETRNVLGDLVIALDAAMTREQELLKRERDAVLRAVNAESAVQYCDAHHGDARDAELFALVSRLPAFDPAWPDETREHWVEAFSRLWRRARGYQDTQLSKPR